MLNCSKKDEIKQFVNLLEEQPDGERYKKHYEKVINERFSIYVKATIAGLIASIIITYFIIKKKYTESKFYNTCSFTGIALLIQFFVYMLFPKKYTMSHVLVTEELREEWNDVYRVYQSSYWTGILVGILAYFFAGWLFCKSCSKKSSETSETSETSIDNSDSLRRVDS